MDIRKAIILLLLLMPIVSAYNVYRGENVTLHHMSVCSGNISVQVYQANWNISNDYNLAGCIRTNITLWKCPCYNNYDLILQTTNINNNTYDMTIDYFNHPIEKDLDELKYKVVLSINNIIPVDNLTVPQEIKDFQTSLSKNIPIVFIIIIFTILGLCGFFGYKYYQKLKKEAEE